MSSCFIIPEQEGHSSMTRATRSLVLLLTFGLAASGARAQNPVGPEIRVNTRIPGPQLTHDVATAPDGRFVVVWQDGDRLPPQQVPVSVKARLYDAAGQPRGGEILIARHKPTSWARPSVGMAADGSFVVVWRGSLEEAEAGFGRRFDANGRPLGARFRLSRSTAPGQEEPDVAVAPDGNFVAVWTQPVEGEFEVNTDIYFRRFAPNGRARGPEAVAIDGNEEQSGPQVTFRPDGSFIVTGQDYNGEGGFFDIQARLFSPTGAPLGEIFDVNEGPFREVSQFSADVAAAADGSFAITWTDRGADIERGDPEAISDEDHTGVAVRFYAADGTPKGATRLVNTYFPGFQGSSTIAALPGGGFRIAWTSAGDQDGSGTGIFSQIYTANGEPQVSRERPVNLERTGDQYAPTLAIGPNGLGAIVWIDAEPGQPRETDIVARRIGRSGS